MGLDQTHARKKRGRFATNPDSARLVLADKDAASAVEAGSLRSRVWGGGATAGKQPLGGGSIEAASYRVFNHAAQVITRKGAKLERR